MNEECLICKAPLTYLEADILMECEICHKKENSKTRCVNGHYVCNECHTRGLDRIIALCMTSASRDPIAIIEQMMALPTCHMHGPEHHVMVGAALLTGAGKLFTGCNVENSAFGLTVCAEQNAIHTAVAAGYGPGQLDILLVAADTEQVTSCCGACRQVIAEFGIERIVLAKGAAFYKDFGVGRSTGTLPFQLAGNVRRGGLIEMAFGLTLMPTLA